MDWKHCFFNKEISKIKPMQTKKSVVGWDCSNELTLKVYYSEEFSWEANCPDIGTVRRSYFSK